MGLLADCQIANLALGPERMIEPFTERKVAKSAFWYEGQETECKIRSRH